MANVIYKPQTPITNGKGNKIYPLTIEDQVVMKNGNRLNATLENMDARWAGSWIAFEDEDGNPSDEPFLHFAVDENGKPVYTGLAYAEDGEF